MFKKLADSLSKKGLAKTAEYVCSEPEGKKVVFCSINNLLKHVIWPLVKMADKNKGARKVVADILPLLKNNGLAPKKLKPLDFKITVPGSNFSKYASMVQELMFDGPYAERLIKIAAFVPKGQGNTGLNITSGKKSQDVSLLWVPESWYKDFIGEDFSEKTIKKASVAVDGMMKLAQMGAVPGAGFGASVAPAAAAPAAGAGYVNPIKGATPPTGVFTPEQMMIGGPPATGATKLSTDAQNLLITGLQKYRNPTNQDEAKIWLGNVNNWWKQFSALASKSPNDPAIITSRNIWQNQLLPLAKQIRLVYSVGMGKAYEQKSYGTRQPGMDLLPDVMINSGPAALGAEPTAAPATNLEFK